MRGKLLPDADYGPKSRGYGLAVDPKYDIPTGQLREPPFSPAEPTLRPESQ